MKMILLTGLTASGKTTVGRILAKSLSADFIDLDERIAEKEGLSVRSFYEKYGKKVFQEIEEKTLKECLELQSNIAKFLIISSGGGLVENINACAILKEKSNVSIFFLDNKPKILFNRLLKKAKNEHSFPAFLKTSEPKDLYFQINYARTKFSSICKKRLNLLKTIDHIKVKCKGLNQKKIVRVIKNIIKTID